MKTYHEPYIWKRMPFVRLVIPFMLGIVLQWYLKIPFHYTIATFIVAAGFAIIISLLQISWLYKLRWAEGGLINLAVIALGSLITYQQDIRHNENWLGHHYHDTSALMAILKEPLVNKPKSYKVEATVTAIDQNGKWKKTTGNIIIYLQKDSITPVLDYGSTIIFYNKLQPIRNSGNPGAFDYARYNAFRDIHYQVYLKQADYIILPSSPPNDLQQWLFNIRTYVLDVLKSKIPGDEESSVAEALLVGYRNDLDKNLVQAYSNTGVVHIIAISGLHLGMIYGILLFFFKLTNRFKKSKFIKAVIIILVLWTFCLVAGAAPSIVRSAVMFSFLVVGDVLKRKASIYNTLAGAACVMLAYNPFFLWDVGFQLSFMAVLSIVVFMKPIYNLVYMKNKFMDGMWNLTTITLSAQVLTFPLVVYYFHQFPILFMVSNFVAVPLSTLILYLEILLIIVSPIEVLAHYVGIACSITIGWMNGFIKHIDQISFAVYYNIQVNLLQAFILFAIIISAATWLMKKWRPGIFISFYLLLFFMAVDSYQIINTAYKSRMVVYNISKHQAIDFNEAGQYQYVGDTQVVSEPFLNNFHLKPARINYRMQKEEPLETVRFLYPFIYFNDKKILTIDKPLKFKSPQKIKVDCIVISKNPKIYISDLHAAFDCSLYVFDSSNPQWKINLWKKDCDSLHLRHHSTPDKGAFVMEL